MKNLAYKWRKIFASMNTVKGAIILQPVEAQKLVDDLTNFNQEHNNRIKELIEEIKVNIANLMDSDTYILADFLDIIEIDNMGQYTSDTESYYFEMGQYIAFKNLLIKD